MSAIYQDARLPASTQTRSLQDRNRPDRDLGLGRAALGDGQRSAAVVIAVTLQRLVDDSTRFWSVEERLVLDALRRSSDNLRDADVGELAAYVAALDPGQLRGVASNIKGIYHELLYVHGVNADGGEITAEVFGATNHPGADVQFLVEGAVIRKVQLKAVASLAPIREHLSRYPEIEVLATTEVAGKIDGVTSTGLSNEHLTSNVDQVFSGLPGEGLLQEVGEAVATSALVSGAIAAGRVLCAGSVSPDQFRSAFGDMAVGAVTATVLDALLGGFA